MNKKYLDAMKRTAFELCDEGFLNAVIAGYVCKALELRPDNVMRGLDYAFDEMTAEEAERFYQTGSTE